MNSFFFGNIIFERLKQFLEVIMNFYIWNENGMNFKEDEYSFQSVENIDEISPFLKN
jgi:hypothetical protein